MQQPAFQSFYAQAKSQLLEGTINRLRSISSDGVTALHRIVNDHDCPACARVNASRAILELMFRAVEMEEFSDRLARLESSRKDEDR